jgi:hypothetical protein
MSAGVGKTYRMLQEAHSLLESGIDVKIDFKTSENPFEGRKSQVDERVAARKRRYIQKFKKAEKKFKR